MEKLYLKKGEERRIRAGHLWVFSNEVDQRRSRVKDFAPGQPARLVDASGSFVAVAYVNPASLICARVVSRRQSARLDRALVDARLAQAQALREKLFAEPYYRAVFSEGDYLPGLIVDRYGDALVAQLTTAGLDNLTDSVVASLRELYKPAAIVLKNDGGGRAQEGLPSVVEGALGDLPEDVLVRENGVEFLTPLTSGQKTGWFYDQRDNRAVFASYARGGTALDVFCYTGSCGLTAAKAGADRVTCVDQSALALDYVTANAERNGLQDRVSTLQGNAFDLLNELYDAGERYDAVCLDPPAFMKRKKDKSEGMKAYTTLNWLGMRLVKDGGVLMTCSCSHHLSAADLRHVVVKAAGRAKLRPQILHQGHQGPDHPIHPAMPETEYLKSLLVRVAK